jgi:DNA-directed RNA polymerase specialized sigma24 family protein
MNQHVPMDEREEQRQVRADDGYAQRERRFRQLYEDHYMHIQAYAVRRLDVQADVADVAAEVFTTAWRRLDDVPRLLRRDCGSKAWPAAFWLVIAAARKGSAG